ncbi:MAG: hypothetical protein KF763_21090 [Cyclobacteriaceae bacterium]|nr:hypothetical protein [Cyclobacteriaceae bacterium]
MKKIWTYLLWSLTISSYGQNFEFPPISKEANTIQDFSPRGWFVSDSIQGDLNKDNLLDQVFIIKKRDSVTVKDNNGDEYLIQPRVIGIAFKNASNKYKLIETNKRLLTDYNFPPTYDDPFNLMTIEKGVLTIEFSFDYINGNFYFYTYKFRFQKGQFSLIGADAQYVTRRTMDFEKSSYNFLTKKWSLTIGTHTNQDPPKLTEETKWFDLNVDKAKTFKTMDRPGTWPVSKESRL